MFKTSLLLAATFAGVKLIGASVGTEAGDDDYARRIDAWHAQRLERLTAPSGWLSLVGLDWLKDGANRIGSAKDNDIVLPKGPAHLGTITVENGQARIELAAGSGALIDGKPAASALLVDDSQEPTIVSTGTLSFYLVERSGRRGLRIKDSAAATRTQFQGLDYFPTDPSWRIEAKWVAFDPPHALDVPNVLGLVDSMPVPGRAEFERDGETYTLLPVLETPDAKELFFIIADRTSGKETYGAARFLYAPMPKDGKVVLDFNQAYNPPCAFTPYATCPMAPPENRLAVAVNAGEKKYRGGHSH